MTQRDYDALPTINDWSEVPQFKNEDEEAEFWGTHGLGGSALESLGTFEDDALPPPRERTRPVAIRFDDDTINRLKAVARLKHKGYQTLLKEFVAERLYEEEKRAGLVG